MIIAVILAMLAGFAFFEGFYSIFVAVKLRRNYQYLFFGLVCFAITVYTLTAIFVYKSFDIESYVFWVKIQDSSIYVFVVLFSLFFAAYTQYWNKPWLGFIAATALVLFTANLVLPTGATFSEIISVSAKESILGEPVRHVVAQTSIWLIVTHLLLAASIVYGFRSAVFFYGKNPAGSRVLIVLLVLFSLCMLHDLLITPLGLNWFFIAEFGFFAFEILVAFQFAGEIFSSWATRVQLSKSEQKFRNFFNSNYEYVIILDAANRIIDINNPACQKTGLPREYYINKPIDQLLWWKTSGPTTDNILHLISSARKGMTASLTTQISVNESTALDVILRASKLIPRDDTDNSIIMELIDITLLKQTEKSLESLLEYKENNIREIHHRVKNNLQIIASLVNLQQNTVNSADGIDAFSKTKNRVHAIALVHEKIHNTPHNGRLDINTYINELAAYILDSDPQGGKVKERVVNTVAESMSVVTAVPVGLIINELLTNSLLHSCETQQPGKISIRLEKEADTFVLTIHDNGKGLPADFKLSEPKGLGYELINSLASQIKGTIECVNENGAKISLKFPSD